MIDETLLEAEDKMDKAVAVAKEDFSGIRTGRATPGMFNKIAVDYYGTPTPVTQLASIQAQGFSPRSLAILRIWMAGIQNSAESKPARSINGRTGRMSLVRMFRAHRLCEPSRRVVSTNETSVMPRAP